MRALTTSQKPSQTFWLKQSTLAGLIAGLAALEPRGGGRGDGTGHRTNLKVRVEDGGALRSCAILRCGGRTVKLIKCRLLWKILSLMCAGLGCECRTLPCNPPWLGRHSRRAVTVALSPPLCAAPPLRLGVQVAAQVAAAVVVVLYLL